MSCEHVQMQYSTFPKTPNNALIEPMFLGQPVNVARYDQQKYETFEKLIEKQISFFWRPEEVDLSRDRIDHVSIQVSSSGNETRGNKPTLGLRP